MRIAGYLLVTWIAPMVLASIQPERPGTIAFMDDFETHLRSFVAIPLLLYAEKMVDPEVRFIVRALASPRRCVRPDELRARVRALQPLVRHPLVGVALFGLAFLLVPAWIRQHTSGRETWIFRTDGAQPVPTAAGTWEAYVVVPLYMFLLLRWLWRWIVLALVFFRSAPLLRPIVSHGDRCGGFSFVSRAPARFACVIAGASCLVSARLLFAAVREDASAQTVANQALGVLFLSVVVAFFPLLAFAFRFGRFKRLGLRRYRAVVEGHARNVEREWHRRPYPGHVSSEESSSLADLNSVYEAVRSMRIVPLRKSDLVIVALAALAPMLPALSSSASIDKLLLQVLRAML